jgi:hypothetical protein
MTAHVIQFSLTLSRHTDRFRFRGARTRRFITALTRVRHRSLSWASRIQSTPPKPISISCTKSHVHIPVLRLCQVIRPVPRLCVVIRNKYWILRGMVVSPTPNPQAGGPPTVGCPRLIIQHIRSYPPYMEAVSSIRNPRIGSDSQNYLNTNWMFNYTTELEVESLIPKPFAVPEICSK